MCAACQAEYDNPLDRRFHAQPNACPECGPRLSLLDPSGPSGGTRVPGTVVDVVVAALRGGAIVAIKGIGGYHLACRAADEHAVARLRARKHREDKPFALMVPALAAARGLRRAERSRRGRCWPIARGRSSSPRAAPGAPVAAAVAPRSADLGVMLPYAPLHHILLADIGEALVMTSANVSDEPIAYLDDDAVARLQRHRRPVPRPRPPDPHAHRRLGRPRRRRPHR